MKTLSLSLSQLCLYYRWISFSFLWFSFFIQPKQYCLFLFLFHTKNSAKLLSNMSLIHWMFWAVPLMLLIQPIIPGSLFPVSWLMFPSSQWFPESCCFQLAWLRELGQLGSLTTRIIATQSLSSAAHQDKEFSASNSKEIALPPTIIPIVASYLDMKQNCSQILDFV